MGQKNSVLISTKQEQPPHHFSLAMAETQSWLSCINNKLVLSASNSSKFRTPCLLPTCCLTHLSMMVWILTKQHIIRQLIARCHNSKLYSYHNPLIIQSLTIATNKLIRMYQTLKGKSKVMILSKYPLQSIANFPITRTTHVRQCKQLNIGQKTSPFFNFHKRT